MDAELCPREVSLKTRKPTCACIESKIACAAEFVALVVKTGFDTPLELGDYASRCLHGYASQSKEHNYTFHTVLCLIIYYRPREPDDRVPDDFEPDERLLDEVPFDEDVPPCFTAPLEGVLLPLGFTLPFEELLPGRTLPLVEPLGRTLPLVEPPGRTLPCEVLPLPGRTVALLREGVPLGRPTLPC
jgi:hypothetical protein